VGRITEGAGENHPAGVPLRSDALEVGGTVPSAALRHVGDVLVDQQMMCVIAHRSPTR
jgi:hypothetical protein